MLQPHFHSILYPFDRSIDRIFMAGNFSLLIRLVDSLQVSVALKNIFCPVVCKRGSKGETEKRKLVSRWLIYRFSGKPSCLFSSFFRKGSRRMAEPLLADLHTDRSTTRRAQSFELPGESKEWLNLLQMLFSTYSYRAVAIRSFFPVTSVDFLFAIKLSSSFISLVKKFKKVKL